MSKAFLLYAHPCAESYCAALKDTVVNRLTKRGWTVDLCDLYQEGFDPVLSAEDRRAYHDLSRNSAAVQPYVDRLQAADSLVFVHPVWNFGMPAILKGFLDRVFLPGVSFRLQDGKVRPGPGLAQITRLAAITTYGATRWRAFAAGDPPRRVFHRPIRYVTQAKTASYLALYDMNRASDARRASFLARVDAEMEKF